MSRCVSEVLQKLFPENIFRMYAWRILKKKRKVNYSFESRMESMTKTEVINYHAIDKTCWIHCGKTFIIWSTITLQKKKPKFKLFDNVVYNIFGTWNAFSRLNDLSNLRHRWHTAYILIKWWCLWRKNTRSQLIAIGNWNDLPRIWIIIISTWILWAITPFHHFKRRKKKNKNGTDDGRKIGTRFGYGLHGLYKRIVNLITNSCSVNKKKKRLFFISFCVSFGCTDITVFRCLGSLHVAHA